MKSTQAVANLRRGLETNIFEKLKAFQYSKQVRRDLKWLKQRSSSTATQIALTVLNRASPTVSLHQQNKLSKLSEETDLGDEEDKAVWRMTNLEADTTEDKYYEVNTEEVTVVDTAVDSMQDIPADLDGESITMAARQPSMDDYESADFAEDNHQEIPLADGATATATRTI
eukprot:IDg2947t1